MPFQKGRAKTGGRKRGVHNKITNNVKAELDALGCNPIEGMARIALDERVEIRTRGWMFDRLCKYIHPELKSIEHTGPGGGPIEVNDVSAVELLRSRIAELRKRRSSGGDSKPAD